jgi:hypothetical protein
LKKFRPWLQGAGLAMLYLLPLLALDLAPGQNTFYHQVMPVTSLTRGALLDLVLLTLSLGAGFAWLHGKRSRLFWRLLWLPLIFGSALVFERSVAVFLSNFSLGFQLPPWAVHIPWLVLITALALFVFARRHYDSMVGVTEVFLASSGIAALLVIPQLVYVCFDHAPPEQASFSHPVNRPWRPGEPRVVWILFDELSYGQVFDHRQAGIHLPAFAQLQKQSVSFSQLIPVGIKTEVVIPSLFVGRPMSAITSNRHGVLLWRSNSEMSWRQFDPKATLFAAARRQGWGTGVAGWYNPYCRVLATTVDHCYWTPQDFAGGLRFNRLSSQRSTLQNARDALPLVSQVENAVEHLNRRQRHHSEYLCVLQQAKSLIQDTNIRFAFVHLPVPHPPGIYPDPLAGGLEDYLGNLILADRTLADLRMAIEKTAAASDTILIVSSDHSWRVGMWRGTPGWTQAEERASNGGQFDDRPVLEMHFPGQTQQNAKSIDRPVNAMIVHSLLLDIFTGKITGPEDVNDALEAETAAAGS